MKIIELAIAGAAGRMGRSLFELAAGDDRFRVVAALESAEHPAAPSAGQWPGHVPLASRLETPCDVLIDFSAPAGTMYWLEECERRGVAMIIGTTGHDEQQAARITAAAQRLAIVRSANFSLGIALLSHLAGRVAAILGQEYDIEIVETHHRHKKDAPSGTALLLLDKVLAATGRSRSDAVFGRQGPSGERPSGQVGVHALRMGEVVGVHEIQFASAAETVTLRHAAHSRKAFAAGALRAAAWVVGRPPGLYCLGDVFADLARAVP
ncbi:MAG: 4-hydroxy-tetrahydrodipicolinate reductase [Planctomycetes bacterium]|nr:4-hydroxy-tetrahydrodipicolinate reductase [Planctomycetota bacterium]